MGLTVKDVIQILAQLDPETPVVRFDGIDDYWGQMYDRVDTVTLEQNVPVDGYKRPAWKSAVVFR